MNWFSDEVLLVTRPFSTCSKMLKRPRDRPLEALGTYLLVLASFVTLTTFMKWHLFHLVNTALFWMFVPANQLLALFLSLSVAGYRRNWANVTEVFLKMQLPWYLFFVLLIITQLSTEANLSLFQLFSHQFSFVLFLLTVLAYSLFLNLVLFTRVLPAFRAIMAYLAYYIIHTGLYLVFFSLTDQLQPLLAPNP